MSAPSCRRWSKPRRKMALCRRCPAAPLLLALAAAALLLPAATAADSPSPDFWGGDSPSPDPWAAGSPSPSFDGNWMGDGSPSPSPAGESSPSPSPTDGGRMSPESPSPDPFASPVSHSWYYLGMNVPMWAPCCGCVWEGLSDAACQCRSSQAECGAATAGCPVLDEVAAP